MGISVSKLPGIQTVTGLKIQKTLRKHLIPYSFLLPSFGILLVFGLYPFLQGLYYSFTDYPLIQGPTFVGLDNYLKLPKDYLFRASLVNTFYYVAVTVPARIILGLALALALNKATRGVTVFRAIFYFPFIVPLVTAAQLWGWMFSTHFGIINWFLSVFGIDPVPWLTSPKWAMPAIMIMSVWTVIGWNMVIFLAGLQGIPPDLYEAAQVDGANAWKTFWHITLPLLRPTLLLVLVISTINSSQVFDQVFVLTNGGPGYATMTLVQQVYNTAFQSYEMGYASAIAVVLFLIVLSLALIQFRFFGQEAD